MAKVSYVISAYNHEAFVEQAVRSLLRQTFDDIEICAIDDGSDDATPHILERLAAGEPRLRFERQRNTGVVVARNRGIALTSGEYVSIVDSDDLFPADRTERLVAALERSPESSLAYGDAWLIDSAGERTGRFWQLFPPVEGPFSARLLAHYCFVPAPSVLFRRAAFERSGPLWGPGPSTDYLKWIELGLEGEVVCVDGPPVGCWRLHGENVSRRPGDDLAMLYDNLRQALIELLGRRPELTAEVPRNAVRRRLSRCHLAAALFAGHARLWPLARKHSAGAVGDHFDLLSVAAWLSTLPVFNLMARPFYRYAVRRWYP